MSIFLVVNNIIALNRHKHFEGICSGRMFEKNQEKNRGVWYVCCSHYPRHIHLSSDNNTPIFLKSPSCASRVTDRLNFWDGLINQCRPIPASLSMATVTGLGIGS